MVCVNINKSYINLNIYENHTFSYIFVVPLSTLNFNFFRYDNINVVYRTKEDS